MDFKCYKDISQPSELSRGPRGCWYLHDRDYRFAVLDRQHYSYRHGNKAYRQLIDKLIAMYGENS